MTRRVFHVCLVAVFFSSFSLGAFVGGMDSDNGIDVETPGCMQSYNENTCTTKWLPAPFRDNCTSSTTLFEYRAYDSTGSGTIVGANVCGNPGNPYGVTVDCAEYCLLVHEQQGICAVESTTCFGRNGLSAYCLCYNP